MYKVGQVIYTVLEDKYKIVPLKVSEQVITKTLEGESTSYKVIMPGKSKKKIDLSKVNNIWEDLEEVKSHLLDNASKAISSMIEESINIQNKYFLQESQMSIDDIDACIKESNSNIINDNDDNKSIIKVDLGNGQIGNLKLQEENLDQKKNDK
tara:strand:- start:402 stop:860 length:459 start_codon:yes stop_codon:yes gene_type:complete